MLAFRVRSFGLASQRLLPSSLTACLLVVTACESPPSSDSTTSADETSTTDESTDTGDNEPTIICEPGETRCVDTTTIETCAPTGLKWDSAPCNAAIAETCEPCASGEEESCVAACVGPCERAEGTPSSEGCSFFTTSIYQYPQPEPLGDAIIVGNPHPELSAEVTLTFTPFGSNIEEEVQTVDLAPRESYAFVLPDDLTEYSLETSVFRSGLVHHVTSNIPIVAYLHAPYQATQTNGSALLLPEHVMTGNYVVYGHKPLSRPSYFVVIAMEDQTTVRWYPTRDTAGDQLPLPFVDAGGSGEQLMNRLDNMRILTSIKNDPVVCQEDLSGTVIEADKPVWVLSATRGARIPFCHQNEVPGCTDTDGGYVDDSCFAGSDLLLEQNLPLEFWGREYIGAASPKRGDEDHIWRIFAGEDDITINVDPPQPGTPIQLAARGDWQELVVPNGTNLRFSSNKVFMPVQYVSGNYVADGLGSPAMVQMVPTAQFLDNYVFVTGVGYDPYNYVQIIREVGGGDIILDDVVVQGLTWENVGDWEVANLAVSEGAHAIRSDSYFGIVQYGWTNVDTAINNITAGYAYPGGMKAEVIFIP